MGDLVNTSVWGGAQWVLATWFFLSVTLFPIIGFYHTKKRTTEFFGWFIARSGSVFAMASVLSWGGFWQ